MTKINAPEPPLWMRDALCIQVDTDLFFPPKGGPSRAAIRVCRACPVRETCLDYALDNDIIYGIWGGRTIKQRRKSARVRV